MYDNKAIYARANTNTEEITVSVLYTIYLSTWAETEMNRWTLQSSCQADNCIRCLDHTPPYSMQQKSIQPRKFFIKKFRFQEAVPKLPTPSSQLTVFLPNPNSFLSTPLLLSFVTVTFTLRTRAPSINASSNFLPRQPSRQSAQTLQLASVLGSVGISPPRLKFDPTSKVGKLVVLKAGLRTSDALWANPLTGLYNQPFP